MSMVSGRLTSLLMGLDAVSQLELITGSGSGLAIMHYAWSMSNACVERITEAFISLYSIQVFSYACLAVYAKRI
jgi:hypothetical protein